MATLMGRRGKRDCVPLCYTIFFHTVVLILIVRREKKKKKNRERDEDGGGWEKRMSGEEEDGMGRWGSVCERERCKDRFLSFEMT